MDTITEPAIAPKKKTSKRRKPAAKPKVERVDAAQANDDLGGLTATECPYDCNPERCVISGLGVCGHPRKGSLQPAVQRDPEAMKRYNAARKALAHQAVDKRV